VGRIPQGLSPQIGHLWPHHRSMARALLLGATPGDLAVTYGFSSSQISCIINSPLFLAELSRLESQAEENLNGIPADLEVLAGKAVQLISQELETLSASEEIWERKTKLDTCFKILDRAGYAKKDEPPPPQEHKHLHLHVAGKSNAELMSEVMGLAKEEA
jgi:hypothetical protein